MHLLGDDVGIVMSFTTLHILPNQGEHELCLVVGAILKHTKLVFIIFDYGLEARNLEVGTLLLGHTLVSRLKHTLQLSRVAS